MSRRRKELEDAEKNKREKTKKNKSKASELVVSARPVLRRKLRSLTEAWAKLVEHKRDGHHDEREEAKEGRHPPRREFVVHLRRKQREARAEERAHDGVGRERGRGDEEVRVDDVAEQAEEDPHDREAERPARHHRCPEGHAGVRRPAEPEECAGEDGRGDDGLVQAGLWRDGVRGVLLAELGVPRVPVVDVAQDGDEAAEGDGQEHQAGDTSVEVVAETEDDGVRFEKQVDCAVNELRNHQWAYCRKRDENVDLHSCTVPKRSA